jgi:hypothetical protein
VKPRRANLGERIAAVELIRAGRATLDETAAFYQVEEVEVRDWLRVHANDRTVLLGEFRGEPGESGRLARQAHALRRLIARADRTLRLLHARLLSQKLASPPQIPNPSQ